MRDLKPTAVAAAVLAAVLFAAAPPAGAQDDSAALPEAPQAFGLQPQDQWVAVTRFIPQEGPGTGALTNTGGHYYASLGPGTGRYAAQVDLPVGVLLTRFECDVFDTSAANNAVVSLFRSESSGTTNPMDVPISGPLITSSVSGFGIVGQNLSHTVQTRSGNLRVFYWINLSLPANDINVQLRGCRFTWNRQVSPAPGGATFADVPFNHPAFRFVEALAAAGITGGCGGGNFCPDAPLTRAQMAVFLSVALGLHFPF